MKKVLLTILLLSGVLLFSSCQGAQREMPRSIDGLSGRSVGVQAGTLYEMDLQAICPDVKIEYYSDPGMMILAVKQGQLDAYLTENTGFVYEKKNNPTLEQIPGIIATYDVGVGIGNVPGQQKILDQMNAFIEKCGLDGTMEELTKKWLRESDNAERLVDKSSISGENGELIIGLEPTFEPYSYVSNNEYQGFDIDFIYRFCREYGYMPVLEAMNYDSLSSALSSGKIHVAMNILLEEERQEEIALSKRYVSYNIIAVGCPVNAVQESFFRSVAESFEKTFLREDRWKMFLSGALTTILITVLSILAGTVLGFLVYLYCRKGGVWANKITSAVIWLLHGTPEVLLLMIFYFVFFGKTAVPKTAVAVIMFSLLFAAAVFGMLESGEKAVGKGQLEAALSQGFSPREAYFLIILPQSARFFLPTFRGEIVSLIKETAIVGYIAITDLTKMSDMVRSRTFEAFFPLISTAVIYFIISGILTSVVKRIEHYIDPEKRSTEEILKGIRTADKK